MNAVAGYTLISSKPIPDLAAAGSLWRHDRTGAQVFCVECPDNNKVFSIGFNTPPDNDCGIPHIIEHSVLCGSDRFPLKDPFIELAKSSLNTFLNAMTFPDHTLYPVASCNEKDLQNLMDVYLDAVFCPKLRTDRRVFMQEGWHEQMNDPTDALDHVGVVYNEMKGAYGSPETLLAYAANRDLFAGTPYQYESGGHPNAICDLTYEQYLAFYNRYYHPSNAYVLLYGDMAMEGYLEKMDREYFSKYEQKSGYDPKRLFPKCAPVTGERRLAVPYGVTEENNGEEGYFSFNAVLEEYTDLDALAVDLIGTVLCGLEGSLLRRRVIESGMASTIYTQSDFCGHHLSASIIAKGVDTDRQAEFEQVVRETIGELLEKGFDEDLKQAALNILEFPLREGDVGAYPMGLVKAMTVIYPCWMNGQSPFALLGLSALLDELRSRLHDGYLEDLCRKLFVESDRYNWVTMVPTVGLAEQEDIAYRMRLKAKQDRLSDAQIDDIVRTTKALQQFQNEEDSEAVKKTVPHLSVADLKREVEPFPYEALDDHVSFVEAPTQGICYLNAFFSLNACSARELSLAGLLCSVLGFMDTEHYDFRTYSTEIGKHVGGMSLSPTSISHPDQTHEIGLLFEAKCLPGNEDRMAALALERLLRTKFADPKRLHEILQEELDAMRSLMISEPHVLARLVAGRAVNTLYAAEDLYKGLAYYDFLKDCLGRDEKTLLGELEALCKKVFVRADADFGIGDTAEKKEVATRCLNGLIEALPQGKHLATDVLSTLTPSQKSVALLSPEQVTYSALVGAYPERADGSLFVTKQMLTLDYLWQQLRVLGGAYGAFCSVSRAPRLISFGSYRDPNVSTTYDAFMKVPDVLAVQTLSEEQVDKYIISTIGGMDSPMTPAARVRLTLTNKRQGWSHDARQQFRDEILSATPQTLRDEKAMFEQALRNAKRCTVGNREAIMACAAAFDEIRNLFGAQTSEEA